MLSDIGLVRPLQIADGLSDEADAGFFTGQRKLGFDEVTESARNVRSTFVLLVFHTGRVPREVSLPFHLPEILLQFLAAPMVEKAMLAERIAEHGIHRIDPITNQRIRGLDVEL